MSHQEVEVHSMSSLMRSSKAQRMNPWDGSWKKVGLGGLKGGTAKPGFRHLPGPSEEPGLQRTQQTYRIARVLPLKVGRPISTGTHHALTRSSTWWRGMVTSEPWWRMKGRP